MSHIQQQSAVLQQQPPPDQQQPPVLQQQQPPDQPADQPADLEQPQQQQQQPQQNPPVLVRVCCVGAGRLGVLPMFVMARACPNVSIKVVDTDGAKIQSWNRNLNIMDAHNLVLPIFEPGLRDLYLEVRGTNRLTFSDHVSEFLNVSDVIFIAVEVPLLEKRGKKELGEWDSTCRMIRNSFNFIDKTVVTISTVPPYFKDMLRQVFSEDQLLIKFLYSPCFMREGSAIADLEDPQVIIAYELHGIPMPPNVYDFTGVTIVHNLYLQWIPPANIRIFEGFTKASLVKLCINANLACRISMVNSFSETCREWGVSYNEVSNLMVDIHPQLRNAEFASQPGVGFGGVGLVEDLSHLALVSSSKKLTDVSSLYRSILKVNDSMQSSFVKLMLEKMNSFKGKIFAVLGFTHKTNTESIKNSPAIHISKSILKIGGVEARLQIFDPQAKANDILLCFGKGERAKVTVMETAFEACYVADAILILTEWPEFLALDYTHIANFLMNQSSSKDIFVGRSIGDLPIEEELGFRIHYIGRE